MNQNSPEMIFIAGVHATRRQMLAHRLTPQRKQKGDIRFDGGAEANPWHFRSH